MKLKSIVCGLTAVVLSFFTGSTMIAEPFAGASFYDFTMKTIDGRDINFEIYKGKVVLVVNVASFCGYTKQYTGLEEIFQKYKDRDFVVIGIPANNYGEQEPGSDEEIKEFCSKNYNVTFQMFSKISTRGKDKHPLYQFLTAGGGNELLAGEVAWNFEKFLIDKKGTIVSRYKRHIEPMSEEVVTKIEEQLSK
ncbi:MAG: glutathione peroxidase [Ignavibacteria bacterium]|nr:glutathione peroxidase [Ignavibacteria bacterium]